jgi:antitoxin component of RelBE/YafQ-DinJ toxin-antitoxin module
MTTKNNYKLLVSMDEELKNVLHRVTDETGMTLAEFIRLSVRVYIKHISQCQ